MKSFSRGNNPKRYKRHYIHEVANSLTDSKYIANDLANMKRYAYRAKVTTIGNAALRPYDPIYLDGLPNGLSGYWTVLSVTHVFGGKDSEYKMVIEVGTDTLGDVNPDAYKNAEMRDVEGELSKQAIVPGDSTLIDISASVNSSPLVPTYGVSIPTVVVNPPATAVPASVSTDRYKISAPVPKVSASVIKWVAK